MNKKQSLAIIEEQILSGMFTFSEIVEILRVIVAMLEQGSYFKVRSKIIENLEKAIRDFS